MEVMNDPGPQGTLAAVQERVSALNSFVERAKRNGFGSEPHFGDSPRQRILHLHRIKDDVYDLLRTVNETLLVYCAELERKNGLSAERKMTLKSEEEKKAMKVRYDTAILALEEEAKRNVDVAIKEERSRHSSALKRMRVQHGQEIQALTEKAQEEQKVAVDRERDSNLCQICFENVRDSVLLTGMHFLYCSKCLKNHNQKDGKCPHCRQPMSGFCKLVT